MQRFINWINLSLKKATTIAKVRKDCTSNTFIIYEFYDRLEEIICTNNLSAEEMEYGRVRVLLGSQEIKQLQSL